VSFQAVKSDASTGKISEWEKLAKLAGWSPMDLPVKWHFSEYEFDMK